MQKEQIEALRKILHRDREEKLREMSLEMRAIYEKTLALRKRIGKGEFDVVKTIRKLCGDDD